MYGLCVSSCPPDYTRYIDAGSMAAYIKDGGNGVTDDQVIKPIASIAANASFDTPAGVKAFVNTLPNPLDGFLRCRDWGELFVGESQEYVLLFALNCLPSTVCQREPGVLSLPLSLSLSLCLP